MYQKPFSSALNCHEASTQTMLTGILIKDYRIFRILQDLHRKLDRKLLHTCTITLANYSTLKYKKKGANTNMLLWIDAAVPALLHIPCLLISWCNKRIRPVCFVLIAGAFYSVIWAFLKICDVESGIVLFCKQIQSSISPAVLTFVMMEWHKLYMKSLFKSLELH